MIFDDQEIITRAELIGFGVKTLLVVAAFAAAIFAISWWAQ
jgi:hypothetical protein